MKTKFPIGTDGKRRVPVGFAGFFAADGFDFAVVAPSAQAMRRTGEFLGLSVDLKQGTRVLVVAAGKGGAK